ncbi:MAG: DUF192 domain-containing protein [Coriobacteriia bacterium]|nr:DUF192 domain-containing protein [Coriobacteriia bacterium]MBN2823441.1 DUF192 domain-containing protein [Coriobacteriia bacterium]
MSDMYAILMRRIVPRRCMLALLAVTVPLLAGCASDGLRREEATLGTHELQVWVAETPAERSEGLNGFDELAGDEGMLFVYPDADIRTFGIKDVTFPLDVVFIAEDGRVSAIESLVPGKSDRRVQSPSPSRYVVEVSQGWCASNGVGVGSVFAR